MIYVYIVLVVDWVGEADGAPPGASSAARSCGAHASPSPPPKFPIIINSITTTTQTCAKNGEYPTRPIDRVVP
jgi:hypothetical protein